MVVWPRTHAPPVNGFYGLGSTITTLRTLKYGLTIAGYASCRALGSVDQQRFQIQGENGPMHFDGSEALEVGLISLPEGITVAVTISDLPSAIDGCSDFQVWIRPHTTDVTVHRNMLREHS